MRKHAPTLKPRDCGFRFVQAVLLWPLLRSLRNLEHLECDRHFGRSAAHNFYRI